jgi:hypothetical protein
MAKAHDLRSRGFWALIQRTNANVEWKGGVDKFFGGLPAPVKQAKDSLLRIEELMGDGSCLAQIG